MARIQATPTRCPASLRRSRRPARRWPCSPSCSTTAACPGRAAASSASRCSSCSRAFSSPRCWSPSGRGPTGSRCAPSGPGAPAGCCRRCSRWWPRSASTTRSRARRKAVPGLKGDGISTLLYICQLASDRRRHQLLRRQWARSRPSSTRGRWRSRSSSTSCGRCCVLGVLAGWRAGGGAHATAARSAVLLGAQPRRRRRRGDRHGAAVRRRAGPRPRLLRHRHPGHRPAHRRVAGHRAGILRRRFAAAAPRRVPRRGPGTPWARPASGCCAVLAAELLRRTGSARGCTRTGCWPPTRSWWSSSPPSCSGPAPRARRLLSARAAARDRTDLLRALPVALPAVPVAGRELHRPARRRPCWPCACR